MIEWILGRQEDPTPCNSLRGDYDFLVEMTPAAPETNSTLKVQCSRRGDKGGPVHVKVVWFRFRNGQKRQIPLARGATYTCQPSDLGSKIIAEITSLDKTCQGAAEVWFCPIIMETMLKQTVVEMVTRDIAVFKVTCCKEGKEVGGQMSVNSKELKLEVEGSTKSVVVEYSYSNPKVTVNQRVNNKVWMEFEKEATEDINNLFGDGTERTSRTHGTAAEQQSQQVQKSRERPIYGTNEAGNKRLLEVNFNSRSLRDSFLFALKHLNTKREMKASLILERMETIDLGQQALWQRFMKFQSLKGDISRLDCMNKELVVERDRKVQDLRNMEEEVASVRQTYLKIIEEKFKDRLDLNRSYSIISHANEDLKSKRVIGSLQEENKLLRIRLLDLEAEVEQLRLEVPLQWAPESKGVFAKKETASTLTPGVSNLLLLNFDSLTGNTICKQQKQRLQQNVLVQQFQQKQTVRKNKNKSIRSSRLLNLVQQMDQSIRECKQRSSSIMESSMIQGSMDTSMGMQLVQQKLEEIQEINEKLIEENERLNTLTLNTRKEMDTLINVADIERESWRNEINGLRQKLSVGMQSCVQVDVSHDNGEMMRLMEQLQAVTEEKDMMLRDIISLEEVYADVVKQRDELKQVINEVQLPSTTQNQIQLLKEENVVLRAQLETQLSLLQRKMKRVESLEAEVEVLRQSNNVLHRSMDMSQCEGEMMEALRLEMDLLLKDNQAISEKCEQYAREIRRLKQDLNAFELIK